MRMFFSYVQLIGEQLVEYHDVSVDQTVFSFWALKGVERYI